VSWVIFMTAISGLLKTRVVVMIALSVAVITVAHSVLGGATHPRHVIHIILGGTYLLPIVAAAFWFRMRGAVVVAGAITLVYYAHIRASWPDQPMENANQFAMIAVYWFVAIVAGVLVHLRDREHAARLAAERQAEREAVIEGLAGLSNALRARDEYTREHSEHVARLAQAIGRRLGLAPDRLELLRLAGLVHDIGKIGVRDDILLKPHDLTADERAAIERHPIVAAEILRPIRGAREIADIVLAHHECPDGSGYPYGRKGEAIPLEAHILRVADVFASLAERRPYKPAMEHAKAMEIIKGLAGPKLHLPSVEALQSLVAASDA